MIPERAEEIRWEQAWEPTASLAPGALWRRKLPASCGSAALVCDRTWSWQLAGGCTSSPTHSSPLSSPVRHTQVQPGPRSLFVFSLREAHFQWTQHLRKWQAAIFYNFKVWTDSRARLPPPCSFSLWSWGEGTWGKIFSQPDCRVAGNTSENPAIDVCNKRIFISVLECSWSSEDAVCLTDRLQVLCPDAQN